MSEFIDRRLDYQANDKNYYKNLGKFNSKLRYSPRQNYHNYKRPKFHYYKKKREIYYKKKPSRPPSPLYGTEEYTQKKIQETSDMIKKQLMMPFDLINNVTRNDYDDKKTKDTNFDDICTNLSITTTNSKTPTKKTIKSQQQQQQQQKKQQIIEEYDVNQIHDKIISHISNLSYAKKINLICSTSSGYDSAIQQIQKQKRLELSKALRDMCSEKTIENTDIINSIIPDIGIKIEQLPFEIIQELSKTLDFDFDNYDLPTNNSVDDNLLRNPAVLSDEEIYDNNLSDNSIINIKTELAENCEFNGNFDDNNENYSKTNDPINGYHPSIAIKTNLFEGDYNQHASNDEIVENHQPMPINSNLFDDHRNIENHRSFDENYRRQNYVETAVQTDLSDYTISTLNDDLLKSSTTLPLAIKSMEEIDKEILRLTKLRQQIFYNLQNNQQNNNDEIVNEKNSGKKRKPPNSEENCKKNKTNLTINENNNSNNYYDKELSLGDLSEKILIIRIVDNQLIAGAESGNLFFIDLKLDLVLKKIQVSTTPVTSLIFYTNTRHLFIGSLDSTIVEYDLSTKNLIKFIPISCGVQCLEISWNYLFIGTNNGNLIRYSLLRNKIEFEENISITNILVLKATQEGARKVLLVGTRNSPICIRDALSGLHMRTMNGLISPTVYTLLLEDSLVYCGTTSHDILVFGFHDGNLLHKYNASNSKGIGCMKIIGNLLFASCYNGNIYVYHKKTHEFVGNIQGPGGVVLSMEIVDNLVIVGTICFKFKSIQIPDFIMKYNKL